MGIIASYYYNNITYEEDAATLHKYLYNYKINYNNLIHNLDDDILSKDNIIMSKYYNMESDSYYKLKHFLFYIHYSANYKRFSSNMLFQKLYDAFQEINNVKSYYYNNFDNYIKSKEVEKFLEYVNMYLE